MADSRVAGVRVARPDDVEAVVAIERGCFAQPNTRLMMRLCGVTDTLLVAEVFGDVRGYVLAAPTGAASARVVSLAVAPAHRREGLGRALMEEALRRLAAKDVAVIELEVRVSNAAAIGLYRDLGFGVVGTKEGYYDDGEDAYLMRLGME